MTCVIAGSTQVWISYIYTTFLMTLAREDLRLTSFLLFRGAALHKYIACERLVSVGCSIEFGHFWVENVLLNSKKYNTEQIQTQHVSSVSFNKDVFTFYNLVVGRFTKRCIYVLRNFFSFVRCVHQGYVEFRR